MVLVMDTASINFTALDDIFSGSSCDLRGVTMISEAAIQLALLGISVSNQVGVNRFKSLRLVDGRVYNEGDVFSYDFFSDDDFTTQVATFVQCMGILNIQYAPGRGFGRAVLIKPKDVAVFRFDRNLVAV